MASKIKSDAKDFESQRQMVVDLLSAAENGDLEHLKKTIDVVKVKSKAKNVEEVLTEFKDGNKRTALHFAAAKGRRKVVTYILDLVPALLNIQDEDGSTPLLLAARENEFSTVRLLLDRGADPQITQKSGVAAIHEAAGNGSLRTVKLLREHGVSLDAESKNGTPLHYAVNEGREKTVEELVQLGADVNLKTPKGVSPFILSCMLNKPTIAKTLVVGNADLSASLPGGITALHIAAEAGFLDIAELLLTMRREQAIALANSTFDGGATPLQLAAGKGHTQLVKLLQPITKGYESAQVDELMAQEKQKMDAYLAEATKQAAAVHEETAKEEETEEQKLKKQILEGVTPEAEIIVPEAQPLTDDMVAKALALKDDGNKAFSAKDFATAIDFYTQAIQVNAADAVLYSNRCAAYLGAGEPKKALNDVRLAKKLKPQWVKALFREGQCLEALGLFEDAAVSFWEAIQLQPKDKALEKRFQEVVAKGREQQQKKKKEQEAAAKA